MIRILTLSILALTIFGGSSMVHADSTTTAKIAGFRFESIQLMQSDGDTLNGKGEVPRPKRPPGPVEPGNEN